MDTRYPASITADMLRAAVDGKAKPVGSLGRIEDLAIQIGVIAGTTKPDLGRAALLVFAGDHGLVAEGVTAYPSDVTALIAQMVLDGTAGANMAAKAAGVEVFLIDAGMKTALAPHPALIAHRIGAGTANSLEQPAMTAAQAREALVAGAEMAEELAGRGYGIFALGEIGIGNSSAAALLAHAVTRIPLEVLTGPGAGAPPGGVQHKLGVLKLVAARAKLCPPLAADAVAGPAERGTGAMLVLDPPANRVALDALAHVAGFEMAMLTGAMLGAAGAGKLVLVDGFIATACAAAAFAISPAARANCVFAHRSAEPGHDALLSHLGARPLLDLGMRLGEGTGAALAIPLVRMAEAMLRDMADLPGAHPS